MAQLPQEPEDSLNDAEFAADFDPGQLTRANELSWALLDDHISDAEFAEFERLLLGDETARETYVRCAHLHADLAWLYRASRCRPDLKNPDSGLA